MPGWFSLKSEALLSLNFESPNEWPGPFRQSVCSFCCQESNYSHQTMEQTSPQRSY